MTETTEWVSSDAVTSAEVAVLGAALTRVDTASSLLEQCPPPRFFRIKHQVIASAIETVAGRGSAMHPELVRAELDHTGNLERCGGGEYLLTLFHAAPPPQAAETLADDINHDYTRRQVYELGQTLMQRAANQHRWDDESLPAVLDVVDQQLRFDTTDTEQAVATLATDMDQVWDQVMNPQPPRIGTGVLDLDALVALEPGDVTTLAARTSVGKSMVVGTIAQHVAIDQQVPVLFAALEMSRVQMVRRALSARARVRHDALTRPGRLTEDDHARLRRAREAVDSAPLFTDYASAIGLAHLRQRLRWFTRTCREQGYAPPGLVVVDYLGIMRATQQHERRQLELAQVMQGLRTLAAEFDVHMLVVHQLNRDADGRTPRLVDLRESGDIEQDSANVLLLHLPDDEHEPDRAGELDVLVAKNRHGSPHRTVTVGYQPQYQRITDLSRQAA